MVEQRLTTTQQAWLAKLLQFDFEIQYKKGKENVVADALSRAASTSIYALSILVLISKLLQQIQDSW